MSYSKQNLNDPLTKPSPWHTFHLQDFGNGRLELVVCEWVYGPNTQWNRNAQGALVDTKISCWHRKELYALSAAELESNGIAGWPAVDVQRAKDFVSRSITK